MPRASYREHRASRARAQAAYGSDADLESIASFSTLASHTTFSSHIGPLRTSPYYGAATFASLGSVMDGSSVSVSGQGTPGSGSTSINASANASAHQSWAGTPAQRAHNLSSIGVSPRISPSLSLPLSSALSSSPSGRYSPHTPAGALPSPGLPLPSPRNARSSSSGSLPAPLPDRVGGASASTSAVRNAPKPVSISKSGGHSRSSSRTHLSAPTATPSDNARSRSHEEKKRKRERDAERWRRVRAREAAHDAPVRRWAKAAYSRLGATGAMAAAVAFAAVFRVVLALIALHTSLPVRSMLAHKVTAARAACSLPPLKSLAPLCSATIGSPSDPVTPSAGTALILGHLVLEAVLGWGAAVAWAVFEGWREGRTVRTRVAAVVYLILAPVLTLTDGALLQMRTAPLGLMAWAILAACSGHDGAAAATIAAAAWAEPAVSVYVPAFVVYAVGKRMWLGPKGRGYLARLLVSATMVCVVLLSLQPVPLRTHVNGAISSVRSCLHPAVALACIKLAVSKITLVGIAQFAALIPSSYLMLRASHVLRPAPTEPYTVHSVPATARLLPLLFVAVASALALPHADAALPLLPLSLASSLRGDDDEWAVAVQTHHIAAMGLWSAFGSLTPLAAGTTLAWDWLIGAHTDAPNPVLRAHQLLTKAVTFAALFPWPRIVAFVPALAARFAHLSVLAHLATAHRVFTLASLALLVVWTNIRLVKAAWAIDAL